MQSNDKIVTKKTAKTQECEMCGKQNKQNETNGKNTQQYTARLARFDSISISIRNDRKRIIYNRSIIDCLFDRETVFNMALFTNFECLFAICWDNIYSFPIMFTT